MALLQAMSMAHEPTASLGLEFVAGGRNVKTNCEEQPCKTFSEVIKFGMIMNDL